MRTCEIKRKTRETDIQLSLNLDEKGYKIDVNCGFFAHMMELFANHSGFNLQLYCRGDVEVDAHHTVEDIGIVLGQAIKQCLGDKCGIQRYGHIILPMDETLIICAIDISGRGYLNYDVKLPAAKVYDNDKQVRSRYVGSFDTELIEEFFIALSREAGITLHIVQLYGKNTHHIIEGVFKAFARALSMAVKITGDQIPSSKGLLE